jgi:hypothetical protein
LTRDLVSDRMWYADNQSVGDEYDMTMGKSRILKAQILLFEASQEDIPANGASKLLAAYTLLKEAVGFTSGMMYQQTRQAAAECFVRLGFMLKDLGTINGLSDDETALLTQLTTDLGNWERTAYGAVSAQPYRTFFQAAQALIRGVAHQSIVDWETDYNAVVATNRPTWLGQISAFGRLWLASLRMVEIGEPGPGTATARLTAQLVELADVRTLIEGIISSPVLDADSLAAANRLLAENIVRQAFNQIDLNERVKGLELLTEATTLLEKISRNAAAPLKAEAELWLAKIMLVRAGLAASQADRDTTLAAGLVHANRALAKVGDKYLLKLTTLSSALQTAGDILSAQKRFGDAELRYRQALGEDGGDPALQTLFADEELQQLFARNYFARAALGDTFNWRREYAQAITAYRLVPASSPAYRQAQLGLAEATMRKDRIYPPASITQLETAATTIFNNEPAGSALRARAVDSLLEAYSTNRLLRERVIMIGNILLGKDYRTDVGERPLEAALRGQPPVLQPRQRADLFLKLAQALAWRKDYEDARTLINEGLAAEPGLTEAINADRELKALRPLILAEISLREDRSTTAILDAAPGGLRDLVFASQMPQLIARLLLGQQEGYTYRNEYAQMAANARYHLAPAIMDNIIERLYKAGDLELDFIVFKFALRQSLTNALMWDRKYAEALPELQRSLDQASALTGSSQAFREAVAAIKAQVAVDQGNIYSYDWEGKNPQKAKEMFDLALEQLGVLPTLSQEGIITKATALFGLAELRRYANGLQDPALSFQLYDQARALLEPLLLSSDEALVMMAKVYLGLAKLRETEGNIDGAAAFILTAESYLDQVSNPYTELQNDITNTYANVAYRTRPRLTTSSSVVAGDDGRSETQVNVGLEIPGDLLSDKLGFWHLTLNEQIDLGRANGADSQLYSTYVGSKFYFGQLADNRAPLTLNLQGRIPAPISHYDGPATTFLRQPDLRGGLSGYWDFLTFDLAANVDDVYDFLGDRNTYYASVMYNAAHTGSPLLRGLRVGPEYNHFHFNYDGTDRPQHQFDLAVRYEYDVTDWFKLKLQAAGGAYSEALPHAGEVNWYPFGQFGVGARFNIGRYVSLNAEYLRTQNAQYPLNNLNFWLELRF